IYRAGGEDLGEPIEGHEGARAGPSGGRAVGARPRGQPVRHGAMMLDRALRHLPVLAAWALESRSRSSGYRPFASSKFFATAAFTSCLNELRGTSPLREYRWPAARSLLGSS